ncbi:MAG: death-on-curing family protein [Actinobacteria bacterium 21-73-9]|nr:MAG: death-on-curing family protein [Actinobacteria bacterium 21-73-9]
MVVYVGPGVELSLPLDRERETIWASQAQIAELFGVDRSRVTRHVNNVFRDEEVSQESNVRKAHIASADRPVAFYSLDVILAVGYRANSGRAIQFRRWASGVLKDYIVAGVAVNTKRLDDLGSIVRLLSRADNELVSGVADVLAGYIPGLQLLREYDDGHIATSAGAAPGWELTTEEARAVIKRVGAAFPQDKLFGHDPQGKLDGTIGAIYQGFAGHDIYPTVEDKAANLLYLVVKDHALADGNKRSAAALFITFLDRNGILHDGEGRPRISNNALAAITLMVALSDPSEKDLMVALITRMLSGTAR